MNKITLLLLLVAGFLVPTLASAAEANLVQNPDFETLDPATHLPEAYKIDGAVTYGLLGRKDEYTTHGFIFSGNARDGGSVSRTIRNIDQSKGRWITFRFHGLAEDKFIVGDNALAMKIEFYSKNGTERLDGVTRLIYKEIENDRRDFTTNGHNHQHGAEVWRGYALEELLPFPEIDTVVLTVIYRNGLADSAQDASFFIDDWSLVQRTKSLTGKVDPATKPAPAPATPPADETKLISLGGRWYYEPKPDETIAPGTPLVVTEANAERLFYKSDQLVNPFANNMTAWLRAGYKDEKGNIVKEDRFVPDNVTITFKGDGFATLQTKNIPNHPTAQFPDTFGTQNYSPSYIQAADRTIKLPLDPVPDPNAKVTDKTNSNHALPMGPIGVAVNGVVFYNPFDANSQDAFNLVDRCCGHPSPDNVYHYHKYPVCVNTPFVDKGDAHSQVIGFAYDGLPVYGPYEEAGIMAMDSTTNPLNAFNAHYDPVRGWHYHVTPGKFPYLIGGYYAKAEQSNFGHGGMRGGGPPFGPGGPRGPGGGRPPPGPDGQRPPPPPGMDFPPDGPDGGPPPPPPQ